jgi:short-subunit dehydrogenase
VEGGKLCSIVITGASSGIGRALALEYATQEVVLGLLGRDPDRLERIAVECRARGAIVKTGAIDVRDRASMAAWLADFDGTHPVDLVVANAGVLVKTEADEVEPADDSYALFQTNVLGVLNTVQPLIPRMMARRNGQMALIASVAAFTPLPHSPSYSASKAAVLNYGLSLRACLAGHGVQVSVVCSGFVETPMIADIKAPKPFNMTVERAVKIIRTGLERNRAVVMFPLFFALMSRIDGLLPDRVRRYFYARSVRGRAAAVNR